MLYAFLSSVLVTIVMQIWLHTIQANSLFGMGKGNDEISQWWSTHFLPIFVLVQGLLMGVVATRVAYLVGQTRLKEAFTLTVVALLIAALSVIAPVLRGNTSLRDALLLWWPVHLWTVALLIYGLRIYSQMKYN